jgi:hypothetical protein
MVKLLSEYDLKPASSGKYIMDASTAPKWIGFIASILDSLQQIFNDESKEPMMIPNVDEKPTKKMFFDKGRVEAVDAFTRMLFLISRNRELQRLFTLYSLEEIRPSTLGTISNHQLENESPECQNSTAAARADVAEVDHGEFSFTGTYGRYLTFNYNSTGQGYR